MRAYRRSPLHAKAYLCWYDNHAEPGAAVVGSSNLTLAGFSGNTELNVRVTGDSEMAALKEWFDALWEDSEDISQMLAVELEWSWAIAQTPPYHVYLKALYELYHTDINAPELVPQRSEELANFQLDAVRRGMAMIDAHGGWYVGDVVGLGKTFVGAELLRRLRISYPHDGPPLILCPAGLKPMWEVFNERFALGAEVVSHSMISAPPDPEFDEDTGRYVDSGTPERGIDLVHQFPNRGPVLVDEAHNFRNINQRSRGLRRYFEAGDHKVMLLSATPQSLGPMDIYRQLTLFLDDTDHGLNLEPVSLEEYFSAAQRWTEYRLDYDNYFADYQTWQRSRSRGAPPLPPSKPTVPRAEIEQAMSPVFIRRRRKDIRELYGDTALVNGQPVRFPEPGLDNVEYRLDKVYAKASSYDDLMEEIRKHKATRYRATEYLTAEAGRKPEYRDLFRAKDRIAKLMAVLLLKRLESSIEAFRSTLNSLIQSNRNFREALDSGYVPIGPTATRLLSGQSFDAEDLMEVLRQEEQRRREQGSQRSKLVHSVEDFNIGDWTADLDADYQCLSGILSRVESIGPEDDDKLRALRRFLAKREVKAGKVLIFSEAETTIEYLSRELNPGGENPEIARLTGSNRHEAETIVKRFSPTWNPVRLIQRFGRVDRIGTEHDVIHLHNMWPDTAVDADLSLTERLNRRIQTFHDLIGLDSRLLSDAERLNANAMYRIYEGKELPEIDDGLDDVAANQRAIALLQRIQEDDPDLWRTVTSLPDGIRSALAVRDGQAEADNSSYAQNALAIEGAQAPLISPETVGAFPSPFDSPTAGETLVLLSAGGISNCYAVGSDLQPRAISPAQFVAAAECVPETPAEHLPDGTNERVMAAFQTFRTDFQRRLGRARRPRDTRARRYVSRQLSVAAREANGNSTDARQIDVLRRIFTADLPAQVESALSEIRELRLEGPAFRTRLEALWERYRLNPPEDSDGPRQPEPQVVRIVCSDGLV